MGARGIRINRVEPGSPGHRLGLTAGDRLLAVNGRPVSDELALKFLLAEECVEIDIRKANGVEEQIFADLSEARGLGIEVEDFHTRTCNNHCLFCFVDQLPPEARPGFRVKDDDYRLSFLHGNYITLTNLPERELNRIVEQALSPLYISVHATEPELRARLLGRKKFDDLDGKLRKLISGGIRLHAQVVLLPGINDGGRLERTVFDLYEYHPGVCSVAIVPLGLSAYGRARHKLVPVTPAFCRLTIDQVSSWQREFRRQTGRSFAYLADEFYLQGAVPLPDKAHYDGFEQIEDGVGMVRKFIDEFDSALARRRKQRPLLHASLLTGNLFYPILADCIGRFNAKLGSNLEVVAAENRFLGRSITVAGLLGGNDMAEALRGRPSGDFIVVPQDSISQTEGVFVDDLSPEDLSRLLGKPVLTSGRTMDDFFDLLCR